ncbi:hypothetical protein VSU19_19850 [Verrucomicrobiales bacterium BCK34]|nr:hypothetical protein [Verrucomicrobiales bacterium BCK34]
MNKVIAAILLKSCIFVCALENPAPAPATGELLRGISEAVAAVQIAIEEHVGIESKLPKKDIDDSIRVIFKERGAFNFDEQNLETKHGVLSYFVAEDPNEFAAFVYVMKYMSPSFKEQVFQEAQDLREKSKKFDALLTKIRDVKFITNNGKVKEFRSNRFEIYLLEVILPNSEV